MKEKRNENISKKHFSKNFVKQTLFFKKFCKDEKDEWHLKSVYGQTTRKHFDFLHKGKTKKSLERNYDDWVVNYLQITKITSLWEFYEVKEFLRMITPRQKMRSQLAALIPNKNRRIVKKTAGYHRHLSCFPFYFRRLLKSWKRFFSRKSTLSSSKILFSQRSKFPDFLLTKFQI